MTIAEMLGYPNADGIKAVLLSFLQRPEFPVTDFETGGVVRTQLELETAVVGDLLAAIAVQLAGGFLDDSSDEWLAILARGFYGLDPHAAAIAKQTITIAVAAGFGPYSITTAASFTSTDGARYFAISGGTLASGTPITIDVIAESPGAARGLVNASPLKGVTVTAAAIKVVSTVPQFGADPETDAALAARCDMRWPSLDVATDNTDRVEKWARAATTEITRVRLQPDEANAGGVVLVGASATGGISGGAIALAQAYISTRAPITDYITVVSASPVVVTAAGVVTVAASRVAEAQAQAQAAWLALLAATRIADRVYLSKLIEIVMDAGAIDFIGATVNGWWNVTLGATEVPVPTAGGLADLTWQGV